MFILEEKRDLSIPVKVLKKKKRIVEKKLTENIRKETIMVKIALNKMVNKLTIERIKTKVGFLKEEHISQTSGKLE